MTCIVGLAHAGKVYLGGDSAASSWSHVSIRIEEKVFKKDNFVFGTAGCIRSANLLQYSFVIPEHSAKKSNMEFLVNDFTRCLRQCLRENGVLKIKDNVESTDNFWFLLGYKGVLYEVYTDFQIGVLAQGYAAMGCGMYYALGAMYSSSHIKNPKKRVLLALEAAANFDGAVSSPYHVVSV